MDFGLLPPEVNSARLYAGPRSESMTAASEAWSRLAVELRSAAQSYSSAISGLTAQWLGPSSIAMAVAATPYIRWLNATASRAEHTAQQARAAAAAYDNAFAAVVPPPLIAANRAQLATLVATNVLGQNASLIAANETQYGDMWLQDAAAMYCYADESAAATDVTPFVPPPQNTDPGGAAAQSASVAQGAGTGSYSTTSQLMSSLHSALQGLASPAAVNPSATDGLTSIFAPGSPLSTLLEGYELGGPILLPARNALIASTAGLSLTARGFQTGAVPVAAAGAAAPGAGLASGAVVASSPGVSEAGPAAAAELGRGGAVGGLSVPPSWARATPTVRLAAAALQGIGSSGTPVVLAAAEQSVFGQMGLSSLVGGVLGGVLPRAANAGAAATPPPNAGSTQGDDEASDTADSGTNDKVTRVLAELSQNPEAVQHWHTDKVHLEGLLEQLSKKPGVHAVHVSKRDKPKPAGPQPPWG